MKLLYKISKTKISVSMGVKENIMYEVETML
jgi:hypothetical protein